MKSLLIATLAVLMFVLAGSAQAATQTRIQAYQYDNGIASDYWSEWNASGLINIADAVTVSGSCATGRTNVYFNHRNATNHQWDDWTLVLIKYKQGSCGATTTGKIKIHVHARVFAWDQGAEEYDTTGKFQIKSGTGSFTGLSGSGTMSGTIAPQSSAVARYYWDMNGMLAR